MIDDDSLEDLMLTPLVIGNRLLHLAIGHPAAAFEAHLMVGEKMMAAHDGFWALTRELFDISVDLALEPHKAESWQAPARAFIGPARQTLRSNARRLAGYRG